jgi:hypothetical protein
MTSLKRLKREDFTKRKRGGKKTSKSQLLRQQFTLGCYGLYIKRILVERGLSYLYFILRSKLYC